jgi:feruloyl-CoA synthase
MGKPPFAEIAFAPARVEMTPHPDGGFILRSPEPLGPYEASVGEMLRRQAKDHPARVFIAERDAAGGWRKVSYAEAREHADAIAQALLDRGLGPERPVMILSGNTVDHALLMLGGFVAGVPLVPVSVAYSLMSGDFAKLRHIFSLVRPGLVYAASGQMFARALDALDLDDVELVVSAAEPEGRPATRFAELLRTRPTPAVDAVFARVGPDTVAKILFTSGSTGLPKGVVNTHRMLCANQQMGAQIWPFVRQTPPVLVDWLPWNHTFGGNHNFNLVLRNGGTLHIDGGKPAPQLIEQTARNLAEIAPTIYFNVPAGYNMLLPYLERDEALCRNFFRRLQLIFYAGAALPQDLWERLEALSIRTLGKRVVMTSSWGSTETAPMATSAHYLIERAGVIGIPVPGVEIKFVPSGSKLEMRVRGPNVTPGYLGRPDLTRDAFDEEGFYRIGDAGRLADPADPAKGIVFDGRTAEDFKLATGTWVHVGGLRVAALAAASPALQDTLVAGHDRNYVGLLAWPNLAACKELCRDARAHASPDLLVRAPEVVRAVREGLAAWNARQAGSSMRIGRVLLLTEPPSIDANEITDKGYINQRAALERRAAEVERLYADPPADDVIVLA